MGIMRKFIGMGNKMEEFIESCKNKILNMDNIEFMKKVPDDFFDFTVADPNYGVTNNEWDKKTDMAEFWMQANRITKNNHVICFCQMPFTIEVLKENIDNFKYQLIWNKVLGGNGFNAERRPIQTHEEILVFGDTKTFYNPEKTTGHPRKTAVRKSTHKNNNYGNIKTDYKYDSTERFPKSILEFSNGGNRKSIIHSTEKPIELMKYLFRLFTKEGFKVFIPFGGSGVDAETSISLGLDFWLTENEEKYCKAIKKRISSVQCNLF